MNIRFEKDGIFMDPDLTFIDRLCVWTGNFVYGGRARYIASLGDSPLCVIRMLYIESYQTRDRSVRLDSNCHPQRIPSSHRFVGLHDVLMIAAQGQIEASQGQI